MLGQTLIDRIRVKLRDPDNTAVTLATSRSMFWYDPEILAVLNACQYSFINFCLERNLYQDLFLLMTSTQLIQQDILPTDYLHYQSGRIEKFSFDVPAKIYLGGDGVTYLNSDLDAFIILNTAVDVRVGRVLGTGTLYYYKKPTTIIAGTFADSFTADVYRLISDYAITILGLKEIQTSRDFKGKKRLVEELALQPPIFTNYFNDKEIITKPRKQENGQ
jgi:hypothetical protein